MTKAEIDKAHASPVTLKQLLGVVEAIGKVTKEKIDAIENRNPDAVAKMIVEAQAKNISNELQKFFGEFDTIPEVTKGSPNTIVKGAL